MSRALLPLTFFFLLVAFSLTAQSRWSVGVNLQTGLSGQQEVINRSHDSGTADTYYYHDASRRSITMGGGMWVSYRFLPWLGLRTGLNYQYAGSRDKRHNELYTADLDRLSTISYTNKALYAHQLQWPLLLESSFRLGGLQPYVNAGIAWQTDLSYKVHDDYLDNSTGQYGERLSRIRTEASVGQLSYSVGVGIAVTERMSIGLRKTWAPPLQIYWDAFHDEVPVARAINGIIYCGIGLPTHRMESRHRNQLLLEVNYSW